MSDIEINENKDPDIITRDLTDIPDELGFSPLIKLLPSEKRVVFIPFGSTRISGIVDFELFIAAFFCSNQLDEDGNFHVFYPTSDENPKEGIHYIFTKKQADTIESELLNHLQSK